MARRVRGPIVIVGAGLTGGTAAKELRKQGYADELLILAEEPSLPFGRPPLTKGYLRGEEDLSGWMVAPSATGSENGTPISRMSAPASPSMDRMPCMDDGEG